MSTEDPQGSSGHLQNCYQSYTADSVPADASETNPTVGDVDAEKLDDILLCCPVLRQWGEVEVLAAQEAVIGESYDGSHTRDESVVNSALARETFVPGNSNSHETVNHTDTDSCTKDKACTDNTETLKQKRKHQPAQQYKCELCNATFKHHHNLSKHEQIHLGSHTCDVCFKAFASAVGLKAHRRILHHEYVPFQCETCKKVFRRSANLYQHRRIHTGKQPRKLYVCEMCGKGFTGQTNLTIHARVHTGERPYGCDLCDKAFTQAAALNCHRRTHTDERPFVCDICGKSFRQPVGLTYHKRTHSGEKPYKCDLCPKAFSQAGPLAYHKRTHTGEKRYKCDKCPMAFGQAGPLAHHKRTHAAGEKSHRCDLCQKVFRQLHVLQDHRETCADESVYVCDICERAFLRCYALIRHRSRHC